MDKKKIVADRVNSTEEQTLSDSDILYLKDKRNRQLRYLLSVYIPLALILLYVIVDGISIIGRPKHPFLDPAEMSDEKEARFHLLVPYVCGFFFLMLTIYFVRFYIQTVAPLIKDLKNNKKLLLHTAVEKTEMAVFSKYYITSPVRRAQQVLVEEKDFYALVADRPLVWEIAPVSCEVFRLMHDGKEISFKGR